MEKPRFLLNKYINTLIKLNSMYHRVVPHISSSHRVKNKNFKSNNSVTERTFNTALEIQRNANQ